MSPTWRFGVFSSLLGGAVALTVACSSTNGGAPGAADTPDGGVSAADDDAGPGEGGAGTGDPFAACKGVEFQANGVYDVDLQAVRIRGKVTVDGADVPTTKAGRITFTAVGVGAGDAGAPGSEGAIGPVQTEIGGDGRYVTTLTPGTYDVGYAPNASACITATTAGDWPCNPHVLRKGVAIKADGVLDLDLETVVIEGKVTLKGQSFSTQPYVTFTEPGGVATTSASAQGYEVRLFKGTYDVGYAPRSTTCGTTAPCNSGVVRAGVAVQASGVLDIDVPMVRASGTVSLDGTVMSGTRRGGALVFSGAPAGSSASITIASDGTYALGLLPGTYKISFSGVPGAASTSPLPRGAGLLRDNVAIKTDGTLDVDVPTATVQGKVTVNGKAAPTTSSRGSISFTSKTGESSSTPIGNDGTYATVVVVGSYDVGYVPASPSSCNEEGVFPCNAGTQKTLSLPKGAGVLDLDLKVVNVTGKLTLNGAPLPEEGYPTVTFGLPGKASSSALHTVDVATDATFATRLLAGTYDVGYGGASCTDETMPLPCNAGTLQPSVTLTSNGALDLDIPSARLTGKVTLGGKSAPDDATERGGLQFLGKTAGAATTDTFGTSGPIAYKMHLLRGRYVVVYAPAACSSSESASAFPCGSALLAGCD